MEVRDLQGRPPKWRGKSSISGCLAHGEPGVLSAVHWDLANQSVTLAADERDRCAAMLEDDAGGGKGRYPLLGWYIGGPLEMSPELPVIRRDGSRLSEVRSCR